MKNWLSNTTVESFRFRTCVKPKLSENSFGETEIIYESLTAQDSLSKIATDSYNFFFGLELRILKASKVRKFR